jgi:hypothetical protein
VLTPEGLVLWLRELISDPMMLCLYTNQVKGNPSADDFVEPGNSKPIKLTEADWTVDAKTATARLTKTFTFSGIGEKIVGWYLMVTEGNVVIQYEAFKDPMPINSTRDKIHVSPVLSLQAEKA